MILSKQENILYGFTIIKNSLFLCPHRDNDHYRLSRKFRYEIVTSESLSIQINFDCKDAIHKLNINLDFKKIVLIILIDLNHLEFYN